MTDSTFVAQNTTNSQEEKGPLNLPPPGISLEFSLAPEIYSLSKNKASPRLKITVTSHAPRPITIYTWGTLLDPHMAMCSMVYHVIDVDSNQQVYMPVEHVRRTAARRKMGGADEPDFWTLDPEEPRVITTTFHFATRWRRRAELAGQISSKESHKYRGQEMRTFLEPGHRYTFGRPNAGISWWRWGTKEENLEPKGAPASESGMDWSEPALKFTEIKETVIEIRE